MHASLKCKASPGQFSGEYAVRIQTHDGQWVSLFVPIEAVELERELSENHSVDAYIDVDVIDQKNDLALVRLPRKTLENGQHITVSAEAIHQEA